MKTPEPVRTLGEALRISLADSTQVHTAVNNCWLCRRATALLRIQAAILLLGVTECRRC